MISRGNTTDTFMRISNKQIMEKGTEQNLWTVKINVDVHG